MANITPYNRPSTDLFSQMRREMDDLFSNWFGQPPAIANWPSTAQVFTPVDLHENEQEFVVRMDIPGVNEKEINVSFQGDLLTIRGERKAEKVEGKGSTRYSERSYGMFTRSMTLPAPVKNEEIRARYKDGVLEVHLPKAQKTATKEIKVETGT